MSETLEWAVVITAKAKDRGQITFSPQTVDVNDDEVLKAVTVKHANRARKILGTHDSKAVYLTLKFVERTVVA